MLFLYGSQTGNAQDVAELLASEATARGIDCCALPMDCISVEEMADEIAIVFVCSTTGTPTVASLLPPGTVDLCASQQDGSDTINIPEAPSRLRWHLCVCCRSR